MVEEAREKGFKASDVKEWEEEGERNLSVTGSAKEQVWASGPQ